MSCHITDYELLGKLRRWNKKRPPDKQLTYDEIVEIARGYKPVPWKKQDPNTKYYVSSDKLSNAYVVVELYDDERGDRRQWEVECEYRSMDVTAGETQEFSDICDGCRTKKEAWFYALDALEDLIGSDLKECSKSKYMESEKMIDQAMNS
jgi:hypothetical protein